MGMSSIPPRVDGAASQDLHPRNCDSKSDRRGIAAEAADDGKGCLIILYSNHELGRAKRKALIRQAENIMEQHLPVLPVAWEKMHDAWYNYVKGYLPTSNYFEIYDVVRWDTAWLDK